MPRKVEKVKPVMRKCDCWLDAGGCYCETSDFEQQQTRFSVTDMDGKTFSRWETLNEAMKDGRKRFKTNFRVYDNLEERIIVTHGG